MAKWQIIDGPHQQTSAPGEGQVWIAMIENVFDPSQRAYTMVVIAGTALAVAPDWLKSAVREAVESKGKTAIEMFLDEQQPPLKIIVTTNGIRPADPTK